MLEKIKLLLTSIRFWQITLAAASVYSGFVIKDGFQLPVLLDSIAIWLTTVAGIGTFDKFTQAK